MEIIDIDYRIEWDGRGQFSPKFQIAARRSDGSVKKLDYSPDQTFNSEVEAKSFAEGVVYELSGA